jgi:PIN domain nuclease of toxin-antitoxin system
MILLDTHVVIWLMTSPASISMAVAQAIAETGSAGMRPRISAASIYELVYAEKRGRIQLNVPHTVLLERLRARFDFSPVTETIALEAAAIPDSFHGDPTDRIIAATAIVENCTLITKDGRIRQSNVCKTLW